jgi:hypothetical protein
MVAQIEHHPSARKVLPNPTSLTPRQQTGINCVRCGRHLGVSWLRLGVVTLPPAREGFAPTTYELFACAPYCVRVKGQSWRAEWGRPLSTPGAEDPEFDNGLQTLRRVLKCLRRSDEGPPRQPVELPGTSFPRPPLGGGPAAGPLVTSGSRRLDSRRSREDGGQATGLAGSCRPPALLHAPIRVTHLSGSSRSPARPSIRPA